MTQVHTLDESGQIVSSETFEPPDAASPTAADLVASMAASELLSVITLALELINREPDLVAQAATADTDAQPFAQTVAAAVTAAAQE